MTVTVYTKTESPCKQCELTLDLLDKQGTLHEAVPGIDTEALAAQLAEFKGRPVPLLSAPIVLVYDENGVEIDSWAGFRPDKIKALAA